MAEIAGIVLGVIPLLISAMEHHGDIVSPVVAFKEWKNKHREAIGELQTQNALYEQNIRLLLMETVKEPELSEMLKDPSGDPWKSGWKRENLTTSLRDKLGNAYEPCMRIIDEIVEIMVDIAKMLEIAGTEKVSATRQGLEALLFSKTPVSKAPDKKIYFRKRVAFIWTRRKLGALLEHLGKCNAKLGGLLKGANEIQSGEAALGLRTKTKFVAPLERIQANVTRIHGVISKSWCTMHSAHSAGLLLEQRLVRHKRKAGKDLLQKAGTRDCFRISLFRVEQSNWIDTEFHVDDSPEQPARDPKGRTVTFYLPDIRSSLLQRITDLCSTVESAAHPHLGFRLDNEEILRGLYEVDSPQCQLSAKTIRLADVLVEMKSTSFPDRDRYILAITLVSSILQLGQTPWLQGSWSKRDILFLRLKQNSDDSIDIHHPYLAPGHQRSTEAILASRPQTIIATNMLALAVMLLEIRFGTPIEDWRRQDYSGQNGLSNEERDMMAVVSRLKAASEKGNLSVAFSEAVHYCVQSWCHPSPSFAGLDFVQNVEEKVLAPLEREMQSMFYWS